MPAHTVIDSHCHLNCLDLQSSECVDDIITQAKASGVSMMLCVSVDLPHWHEVMAIAKAHDCVKASIGVHPNDCDQVPYVDRVELLAHAKDKEVVAIGETGLDYYRQPSDAQKQRQQKSFIDHIAVAKTLNKPLIVHTRSAPDDTMALLKDHGAQQCCGVMHCFTESWQVAKKALDLGFYISFSGIITFKNAESIRQVAKQVPMDRLLVETDSPYLAPVPHRGKSNVPAYVTHVAAMLAQIKAVDYDVIAQATSDNFHTLFKTKS